VCHVAPTWCAREHMSGLLGPGASCNLVALCQACVLCGESLGCSSACVVLNAGPFAMLALSGHVLQLDSCQTQGWMASASCTVGCMACAAVAATHALHMTLSPSTSMHGLCLQQDCKQLQLCWVSLLGLRMRDAMWQAATLFWLAVTLALCDCGVAFP
jgi:hypothetical protein